MENTEKLKNSKEVIAYIAECFPKCFTLEGEAKPLKIGIFQDLAERLSDDPKISKTQIRAALRQYTSSWRYLRSIKPGTDRVDLDGNSCGTLEQEHIDHAHTVLVESKAKAREIRKEKEKEKEKEKANQTNNSHKAEKPKVKKLNYKTKSPKNVQENKVQPPRALTSDELVTGHQVKVNMGKGNMVATIVEINKEDVRVQLANGLQMVVKAEHLCA